MLDERGALPTILGEVRSDGTERLYAYGPEGFAAQKVVGGAVEYPLLDGLGSVRHLTDGSGNLLLSRSYDAFGNVRHSSGTGVTRLGYTGELQDLTTGLVYLRARFYHPVLGRFLQRDSFAGFGARPQSINRYSYTENNPVNYTDPSGHYVDTLFDIGSIGYDLYRIVQDNILHDCDNLGQNVVSLLLDVGGAALPFATGLGVMYRAGKMARFARWWDDFQILHKTGIWGGTIRDIAKALPSDVVMGVRARPMAAGMWELLYKNIGWPVPKPLKDPRFLNAAAELTKRPFVSFEIGLRRMQRLSDGKTFLAHSDIDPQFIIKGGVPILNNQEVLDMIGMINSQIGTTLLQHGDNFSGMWNVIKGASKTDLDRTTVLISNSGYIGRSGDRMGHAAFLGMISDEWRDVFRAFLDQPNFGSKWW